MKKLLPLLFVFLLLAGCAQNEKKEEKTEPNEATTAVSEPQTESKTVLETISGSGEHEIRLPLVDEGLTVPAKVQDNGMQADFPPKTTSAATAAQTTASSAPTTAKADKETQNTITTTTTKPAASQNTTTTTKPVASQNNTTSTAASGTPKTTSAATLPTADSEKGRYELPAIPLG